MGVTAKSDIQVSPHIAGVLLLQLPPPAPCSLIDDIINMATNLWIIADISG